MQTLQLEAAVSTFLRPEGYFWFKQPPPTSDHFPGFYSNVGHGQLHGQLLPCTDSIPVNSPPHLLTAQLSQRNHPCARFCSQQKLPLRQGADHCKSLIP